MGKSFQTGRMADCEWEAMGLPGGDEPHIDRVAGQPSIPNLATTATRDEFQETVGNRPVTIDE